jgi:methionyl-tRNA formyltransferase
MQLTAPPIKTASLELGLRVMQPEKASSTSALDEIRELGPDAAAVIAYGQMLKRDFLDLPPRGCINLHPSLLPRYRGPTPIQSAILAGERKTGVTTILLDEGMDTGDILLQREVGVADEDTAGTLHDTLAQAGAGLMVETLDAIETHSVVPRPQDESKATVTRKFSKEDAMIDWTQSSEKIHSLARAMSPWPACRTMLHGAMLKVLKTIPCETHGREGDPGQILQAEGDSLIVQAGRGAVRILELQLPGGRGMSVGEFMRGHSVKEGTVLGR